MMTIAIITYDISPYRGSEASVSWNYVCNMRFYHKLIVLYGRGKEEIEKYLQANELENVTFINVPYVEIDGKGFITDIKYNWNYRKWHKKVYQIVTAIVEKQDIDIIHYLNPIGFKEPGFCWQIKDKLYVWGPMQGVENRPLCLWKAMGKTGIIDAIARLVLHNGIMFFSPRVRRAVKRADCLMAATPNTVKQMKRVFGKQTVYLPENGITHMCRTEPIHKSKNELLRIVWIGSVCHRKALILLIDALSKVKTKAWRLDVLGDGPLLERLRQKADQYGISENIKWRGAIPRTEVMKTIQSAHLHVISSLGEGNPTTLWEAMSWAVPTMTLDHCGMAGVVCEKCGIKIPIHSYKQVTDDIAHNIEMLSSNPDKVTNLSEGVIECSKQYLWECRVGILNNIYSRVLREVQR
ncbi:glycosyltransferase family 4 protein [Marseilla massiliensis]|uniref:Glycosyltransferase family 4 protein n=1 Tax=Marseilla massiliensis TaxID=1841864 RepID=A0A939B5D2_9BACT|nr:glycosyltransferase family 4 protein [Marseilla massiliensis]MBM6662411.1 glycosyltransferase family 4 protein [Marseilla massiliensis]